MNTSQAKSREYGAAAMKGWAALHVNAPINLINGLTEPLRGVAAMGGAYIPPVPRWEAMEKSEYWQAGNKGQAAELAGTVTAGVLAGGSTVLATTPGKVIATLESTYNIGVGAAGVDPTQGNRAMSPLERTARVVGGAVTAASVSRGLGGTTSAAGTAAEAEAVTAEGVKIRVPVGKTTLEKTADPMEISISADEANFDHIKIGRKPPYGGTRARDIVLQKDTVFVRVHGDNNQARSWMMRAEDIEGLTAQQIKDKFALPELPKYVSDVHAPKGTRLVVGKVAPQDRWGNGGGIQYEIKDVKLSPSAFRNKRSLP